jgi:hypothetical protein
MTETPETPATTEDGQVVWRTPDMWCEIYGLAVVDPDGWRGEGAPDWEQPLTLPDFASRFNRSTVAGMTEQQQRRFAADVKAARLLIEAARAQADAEAVMNDTTEPADATPPVDAAAEPPKETNAAKLKRAATALRMRGWAGDDSAADMLERCEPIANHWSEPYAAVFVPLLESALRLARVVLDDEPDQRPLLAPGGKKLIRMAVTGELLGAILHLPDDIRVHGVDYYAQLDRFDFLVHNPGAPAEAIRMSPIFERSSGWPDPIHLCDIRYAYPPGVTPPAEPAKPRPANLAESEV